MSGKALRFAFCLLLIVIVLAAFGPMLVQDTTTGNPGGALDNIKTSIEQTNDALENSDFGEWLDRVTHQLPQGLDGIALVLTSRPKPVKAGGATGRHLVGIIRNGKMVTVVLTDNLSPTKHRVKVVVH